MFRKTRIRIVAIVMSTLILLFAITFSAIILISYHMANQRNRELLAHYVENYSLDHVPKENGGPGQKPDREMPPSKELFYDLSTFYSVALADTGDVLAVDFGGRDIYTNSELVNTAEDLLEAGKSSGSRSDLIYQIEERDGYTLIAFMDNLVMNDNFRTLIRYVLIVGSIVLVICFFLAFYGAYRIVKPLEESDRKQKQFISDAGHELKTPVAVIATNAELLSQQIGSSEWLDNIQYENDRMGDLVTQLLDLQRTESAQIQKEKIDFSYLIEKEAMPFESVAFEKGLKIQYDIADGITLKGDPSQLSRLVGILVDNAISHTNGGNDIVISLREQGGQAVFVVENYGEEIPPDKQALLFERFFQVDEARSNEDHHYGLGLAIAKAIVLEHNGNISVSCHDGKVFLTVRLPETSWSI